MWHDLKKRNLSVQKLFSGLWSFQINSMSLFKGMWYLRKLEISCEQFGPVFICFCAKYIKFCFQNLGNGRWDKNGRRYTTFSFSNEQNLLIYVVKLKFFFIFEIKSSLCTSVFIFIYHFPNFENKILCNLDTNM